MNGFWENKHHFMFNNFWVHLVWHLFMNSTLITFLLIFLIQFSAFFLLFFLIYFEMHRYFCFLREQLNYERHYSFQKWTNERHAILFLFILGITQKNYSFASYFNAFSVRFPFSLWCRAIRFNPFLFIMLYHWDLLPLVNYIWVWVWHKRY